jgi:hypothetical protein
MIKRVSILAAVIIFATSLTACGQSSAKDQTTESSVSNEQKSDSESNAVGNQTAESEDLLVKYGTIIEALENNDYDGAVSSITSLKEEYLAETAGDINDYLVTVELTPENFNDYFEFVTIPGQNAFGERSDTLWVGVRSKKYDEGLILYDIEGAEHCDDITIEFITDLTESQEANTSQMRLAELLSFLSGFGGYGTEKDSLSYELSRIAGSKLTYIKKEYIDSYEIPPVSSPDLHSTESTVVLKNGESFNLWVNPDYPY